MCINITTNAEIIKEHYINKFSGRDELLKTIYNTIELTETSSRRSIINLFGIGGIGKTSILEYMRSNLKIKGIP